MTYDRRYRLNADCADGNYIQAVDAIHPLLFDSPLVRELDPKDQQLYFPDTSNIVVDIEPISDCTKSGSGCRISHGLHKYPVRCRGDWTGVAETVPPQGQM